MTGELERRYQKKVERTVGKIVNEEYGGDASSINDSTRRTIILRARKEVKIKDAIAFLKEQGYTVTKNAE